MVPSCFTIRPATEADYDALCAIWAEGDALHRAGEPALCSAPEGDPPPPARSRDYVLGILGEPEAALYVAEGDDGSLWGLLHALARTLPPQHPLMPSRRQAMVDSIVVICRAQRRGVGAALMTRAAAWAAEMGAGELELTVWEFNRGAIAFYEHLGYRPLQRRMVLSLGDQKSQPPGGPERHAGDQPTEG